MATTIGHSDAEGNDNSLEVPRPWQCFSEVRTINNVEVLEMELDFAQQPCGRYSRFNGSLAMQGNDAPACPAFPLDPQIRSGEVHVVKVHLDRTADLPMCAALLDDGEREHARRFVYERDRRRFIVAHAMVRITLARCLARPAAALSFATNAHGKPHLTDDSVVLRFNLSHAGELALLAIARGSDVGVDIEQQHPVDVMELSRLFSLNERIALASLAEPQRLSAVFRCWTRKESFIKALGLGLAFPLDGFDVDIAPTGPQFLRSCTAAPAEMQRWRIMSLPIDNGYEAAVTVAVDHRRVITWNEPLVSTGARFLSKPPKGRVGMSGARRFARPHGGLPPSEGVD